jgi:integrase
MQGGWPPYNTLYLFGGYDGGGRLNDLRKFDGTDWTWVAGDNITNQAGVYGTQGQCNAGNNPGSRPPRDLGDHERLAALPRTGPFVFDNDSGHYKDHNIIAWLRAILRQAGMPWRGTHILRKTCGTRIADGGGGVSAVATHLRHRNLQTFSPAEPIRYVLEINPGELTAKYPPL